MGYSYLEMTYPELPPSSNKIYFQGTRLTGVARAYAERFAAYMRRYLPEISRLDPTCGYSLHLRFYFETLENLTWNNPKVKESKRAQSRYKKIDLSNRIKLLEDCIRDAIDIDDSQTFAASQEKHQCKPGEPEHVDIILASLDVGQFGLTRR